jgi:periplasmic protein TonB
MNFALLPPDLSQDKDAPAGLVGKARDLFRKHRAAAIAGLGAVGLVSGLVVLIVSGDDAPPLRKVQEFTVVTITPPPPPPPPPPQEQKIEEPEMIEQEPIVDPEVADKPPDEEPAEDEPPAESDEPPLGPLGLDAEAEGPGDAFNLAGNPGGNGLLNGGGGGAPPWTRYAAIVQREIEAAIHANPKTRNSSAQVRVRIWADRLGRIARVELVTSSGNPDVDAAIRSEVLTGLSIGEPPPADMPMPVLTRITTRRPS